MPQATRYTNTIDTLSSVCSSRLTDIPGHPHAAQAVSVPILPREAKSDDVVKDC